MQRDGTGQGATGRKAQAPGRARVGPVREAPLLDAVLAIAADLSLPVVLRRMVESAVELTGAHYGALGVIGSDGNLCDFVTVGLTAEEEKAIGPPPKGHGLLGTIILDPQPLRLSDLTQHPDSFGVPPHHPPMHTFLGVPIRVRGRVFGNLYLTEKAGGFTDEDEELIVALAAAAGVAIENARLNEQMREYAVLSDRERIARDLHDKVIQRLFATGMSLQATLRMGLPPDASARIELAVDDLDGTIREVRSTIFDLESRTRRFRGLRAELLDLALETASALGFEPMVEFDGPVDASVTRDEADEILTIVREALTNVARHAQATKVRVRARVDDGLVVEVVDDGVGISGPARTGARGLRNMTDRAEALGGVLEIVPADGGGTAIVFRLPA